MKLYELKRAIKKELAGYGIRDEDQTVLSGLFEHAFNFSLNFLLSEPQHEIDEDSEGCRILAEDMEKLSRGMPLQYVTGKAWFCGHRFYVNSDVLIPRMETELLVAHAADYVQRFIEVSGRAPRILDLCSGSGAIGISLKYLFPEADVTLSDISRKALQVSMQNAAEILGDSSSLNYVCGSFLSPFTDNETDELTGEAPGSGSPGGEALPGRGRFDIILSNPPYVSTEAIKKLPASVRDYEPGIALDGGPGGILPYREIARSLRKVLSDIAFVLFEIGETQGNAVASILRAQGFSNARILKDLDKKDRFVKAVSIPADFSESDPSFALISAAMRSLSVTEPVLPDAPQSSAADAKSSADAGRSENAGAGANAYPAPQGTKTAPAQGAKPAPPQSEKPAPAHIAKPAPPLNANTAPAQVTKPGAAPGLTAASPVSLLKGIGPKITASLAACGVITVKDLLGYFPLRYEDRTRLFTVNECRQELLSKGLTRGNFLLSLKITSVKEKHTPGLPVTILQGCDVTGDAEILFFNNKFLRKMIFTGRTYLFYGTVRLKEDLYKTVSLLQPRFVPENDPLKVKSFVTVNPVYRLRGDLRQQDIKKAVAKALALPGNCFTDEPDVPAAVLNENGFPGIIDALRMIHAPSTLKDAETALRRFSFVNMLNAVLCIKALKNLRESDRLTGISFPLSDFGPLDGRLAFRLTEGQKKVIRQVTDDMADSRPMNRLIDGDVGSGKTIIALYAIYNAVRNGFQAAFMVPSTVLAEQHTRKTSALFEALGIRTALLYSSTTARERRRIEKLVSEGEIDLVIGTHSLLNESVVFRNPGLFVIDEQHRFGVAQRALLASKRGKNGAVPDVLSLSATPIPRSLALILYGDMDISILDEKPAGRQQIETYLYTSSALPRIYERVRNAAGKGSQIYMVYSKISDKDEAAFTGEGEAEDPEYVGSLQMTGNDGLQDDGGLPGSGSDTRKGAVEAFSELSSTVFKGISTGLIHGKMKDADKKSVMDSFAAGEIKILFATTVIEVGIDVPAANIIIINNAERFGLSTLHQLRGRVGRGSAKSFCLMVSDSDTERLKFLTTTDDGFKIAEKDLELRGPGEFFGTSQSGRSDILEGSALLSPGTVEKIRSVADNIFEEARQGNAEYKEYYDRITAVTGGLTL